MVGFVPRGVENNTPSQHREKYYCQIFRDAMSLSIRSASMWSNGIFFFFYIVLDLSNIVCLKQVPQQDLLSHVAGTYSEAREASSGERGQMGKKNKHVNWTAGGGEKNRELGTWKVGNGRALVDRSAGSSCFETLRGGHWLFLRPLLNACSGAESSSSIFRARRRSGAAWRSVNWD